MRFWLAIPLLLLLTPSVALSDVPSDLYYATRVYQSSLTNITTSLFGPNLQIDIEAYIRIHTEGGITTYDIFDGRYECGNTVCGAWRTMGEIPLVNNFVWQSSNWTEFAASRNFTSGDVRYFGQYFPLDNIYQENRYDKAINYTLTLIVDTVTGITQVFVFRNVDLYARGASSQEAIYKIGKDPMILQGALYQRDVALKRQMDFIFFILKSGVVILLVLVFIVIFKLFLHT